MGLTPDQNQTMLTKLYEAQLKVLDGQSYSIGGRTFTMADLDTIDDLISKYEDKVDADAGNEDMEVMGIQAYD